MLVGSKQGGPSREELGGAEEEYVDVEEEEPMKVDAGAKRDPKRMRERCRQAERRLAARGEVAIM